MDHKQAGSKLELLAPAGSYSGILAAYRAGADAVYTGGSLFSARAYADNCSQEELISAIRQAHLLDKKLYLTVNTLLKEPELTIDLKAYLDPLVDAGLDAVIVQDVGVLQFLKTEYPDLDLHASTQMTLAGPDGALLFAPYITRLVTPRELDLSEIKRNYDATGLEIECFIHGALCYCYSGRCLMSSAYGPRSGNRGRCAQPCRLDYSLLDPSLEQLNRKKENLLISPKDLCGIDRIRDLADAGVYSFKIEGRMKKPEYTAGVVAVYRKYLDLFEEWNALGRCEDPAHFQASKEDLEQLTLLFSRNGFTDGYYDRQNGREMLMIRPKEDRGENQFLLNELKKKYVDPGAPKARITMDPVSIKIGEPLTVTLSCRGQAVSVTSESRVSTAQKRPMLTEDFADKLNRFGSSPFELSSPPEVCILSENVFFPVGELNALRQKATALLEEKLLQRTAADRSLYAVSRAVDHVASAEIQIPHASSPQLSLSLRTTEQLRAVLNSKMSFGKLRIIFSAAGRDFYPRGYYGKDRPEERGSAYDAFLTDLRDLTKECRRAGHEVLLEMPEIFRKRAEGYFDTRKELLSEDLFDGFLIHSADELGYLRRNLGERTCIITGDSSLYVMNPEAWIAWRKLGLSSVTLSEELTKREMLALCSAYQSAAGTEEVFELPIYGRRPVMVSAQCLENTVRGCALKAHRQEEDLFLSDRRGAQLPVLRNCLFCYNTIYNAKIFSLLGEDLSEFAALNALFRISFLQENAEDVTRILQGISAKKEAGWRKDPSFSELGNEYTRGHFREGVL